MGKRVSLIVQGRTLWFRNAQAAQEFMAREARRWNRQVSGKTITDFEPCAASGFSVNGERFRKTPRMFTSDKRDGDVMMQPRQRDYVPHQVNPVADSRPLPNGYLPVKGAHNQTRLDRFKPKI